MESLKNYFSTDWAAMTGSDWVGLMMTLLVFFSLLGIYIYVWHPRNKQSLEAHRHMIMTEDPLDMEKTHE